MGKFIKGEVVIIPFPFSDLSGSKKRPAFVMVDLEGDDIVLCQITSHFSKDRHAIPIKNEDFQKGNLINDVSYIRPNRIFTADKKIIVRSTGILQEAKTKEVSDKVIKLLS